ncbi:uncharacterized protein VTP21DRAFT_10316 [Calcarisporiella thermophila]|uniref:uncharacterized protein n=1 Tax=Calcarisporiella thermophila TaxID=911321 RepID=UPI0037443ABD
MSNPRSLFGGAIAAYIPDNFLDASTLREIPDNQEVFVSVNSDQSIIIELLQLADEAPDEDAAKYHFEQLASDNEAESWSIESVIPLSQTELPHIPSDARIYFLTGRQVISKFKEHTPGSRNLVDIYLTLIRLPSITTDIIITYNSPVIIGEESSSRILQESAESGSVGQQQVFVGLKQTLESLQILDWGLFR